MALTKCMECGGLLSDTAKNCPHCGAPVVKCHDCGKPLPAETEICPNCGARQQTVYEEIKVPSKLQSPVESVSKSNGNASSMKTKIWLGVIIVIMLFLVSTNPDKVKHERVIRHEISGVVDELRDSMGLNSGVAFFGGMIFDEITKSIIGQQLEVDNYWLCSIGKIEFQDKKHIVTIGLVNNVFSLFSKEDLKDMVLQWQRNRRNDVSDFFGSIKDMFGFGDDAPASDAEENGTSGDDNGEEEESKSIFDRIFK